MRTALDFGPLLAFLAAFLLFDIFVATAAVMVASFISLAIHYKITRKIAPIPAFTCVVMLIMGGLTLYLRNETFLMMKPTIVYVFMGAGLIFSARTGKNILGTAMGPYMKMPPEGWKIFLTRFGVFCFFAAGLNEVLRHLVQIEILTLKNWVTFKVFGFTALFFLFSMSQAPLLSKYLELEEDESQDPDTALASAENGTETSGQ